MTEHHRAEPGRPEPVRFVHALTGRPLPAPADNEPPGPRPAPASTAAAPVARPTRSVLDDPLRVGLLVAGMLVLVAYLGVVMAIGRSSEFTSTSGAGMSVRDPATTPKATSTRVPDAASISGWQVVVSDDQPFAFDVPADWTVADPRAVLGFATPNGESIAMYGGAKFTSAFCSAVDASPRAQAGFATIDTDQAADVTAAAKESITRWARAAFGSADGTQGPRIEVTGTYPVRVFTGTVEAMQVTATVWPAEPTECSPPKVSFTAVALPLDVDPEAGNYHVHLVLADQDMADSVPADVTAEIIGSIRPAG